MEIVVSVIMPVFNAAEYLPSALASVTAQTAKEGWELILVDDGSTDGSGALCDGLAARDERARVIHLPQNGGLSGARNAGLAAAKGQTALFMDADDWIEEGLLAALMEEYGRGRPQMIVFGVTEEHYDSRGNIAERRLVRRPGQTLEGEDAVRREALELERATLLGYAWNKLYDLSMLREKGIGFEQVELIEDILFNLRVLPHVRRMTVLDMTPYHYARREGASLTHRFLPRYYSLNMRRLDEITALYRSWGMEKAALEALAPVYTRYMFSAMKRNCDPRSGMDGRARREFLREAFDAQRHRAFRPCLLRVGGLPARLLAGGSVSLCRAAGRGLYFMERGPKGMFARLTRGGEKA